MRARGSLDVDQLLHRQAISKAIRDRRYIIHAIDIRRKLRVSAILGDLLDPPVQVPNHALDCFHPLAIQLQHQAQNAVRRRVLRPHVQHQLRGLQIVHRRRRTHWPLSMPRFAFTQSWSIATTLSSFRSGWPCQSSGIKIRFRLGWPTNAMPNMSKISRSSQLAAAYRLLSVGAASPSSTKV